MRPPATGDEPETEILEQACHRMRLRAGGLDASDVSASRPSDR